MIDISIIIVSYKVKSLLIDCVQSIFQNSNGLSIEIIIVDNNSNDGSVEAVKQTFKTVTLIENNFNAGFSGANNQGMNIAHGEYIFLLNPDTVIIGNAMQQLHNYLSQNKECAIVAPRLLNADNTTQISVWKNHAPIDLILETFFLHKLFHRLDFTMEQMQSTFEVKTASGAALFFKRELIQQMGMLEESLFWMEDIDFCKRAQHLGKVIYLPEAEIIHRSGQSQKRNYNAAIANQLLSKLKYYRKNNSFMGFLLATFCCFIFILSRLIAFTLLSAVKNIYALKSKAYWYSMTCYFKYLFLNDKKIA